MASRSNDKLLYKVKFSRNACGHNFWRISLIITKIIIRHYIHNGNRGVKFISETHHYLPNNAKHSNDFGGGGGGSVGGGGGVGAF